MGLGHLHNPTQSDLSYAGPTAVDINNASVSKQHDTARGKLHCIIGVVVIFHCTVVRRKCEILVSHRPLAMKQLHLLAGHFLRPCLNKKIDQTRLTRHKKVKTQTHSQPSP